MKLQILRGIAAFGSAGFFVAGLYHLPVADATAINFVSPLLVTGLAASWLKEHVGDEDKVLAPWTPLVAGKGTVKVWGREIKLSGLALPEKISVGGQPLLAEPAYFEIAGGDGRLQGRDLPDTGCYGHCRSRDRCLTCLFGGELRCS